jgi:transposase
MRNLAGDVVKVGITKSAAAAEPYFKFPLPLGWIRDTGSNLCYYFISICTFKVFGVLECLAFYKVLIMWRPWVSEENSSAEINEEHAENEGVEERHEINEEHADIEGVEERNEAHSNQEHTTEKNKKSFLTVDAKEIILNVYNTLKEDNVTSSFGLINEVSRITKTPYTRVWRIVTRGISERKIRRDIGIPKKLNEYQHAHLLRRIIYDLYSENLEPTLKILQQKLSETANICVCIETLRKFLMGIGFDHKTINKRSVLMETRAISEWRCRYLTEIKKRRDEGKSLIYLDETWFHSYDTVKKGWLDKSKKCVLDVLLRYYSLPQLVKI